MLFVVVFLFPLLFFFFFVFLLLFSSNIIYILLLDVVKIRVNDLSGGVSFKISVNDRSGVKIRVVSREGGGEGRVERSLFIFVLCVFSLF
jgi:hypothetical protein